MTITPVLAVEPLHKNYPELDKSDDIIITLVTIITVREANKNVVSEVWLVLTFHRIMLTDWVEFVEQCVADWTVYSSCAIVALHKYRRRPRW